MSAYRRDALHDPQDRFEIMNEIGLGGFARVYKAWDNVMSKTVAIKLINLEDIGDEVEDVHKEIAIMSTINNCPQLVQYFGSYVVGSNLWIVMVMQFIMYM